MLCSVGIKGSKQGFRYLQFENSIRSFQTQKFELNKQQEFNVGIEFLVQLVFVNFPINDQIAGEKSQNKRVNR